MRTLAGVSLGWLGISMVADGVPALLVPHQVAASGADASTLGLTTLVAIGLAAIAQPFAGAWSDRIGRAPVVVAGVAAALAGLALLLTPNDLLAGTVVTLVGVSVAQAGYQPLLPDRLGMTTRGRGAGAKGMFDVGGAFLAFALLAALLADGDLRTATLLLGAGLAGSLLVALLVLPRRPAPESSVMAREQHAPATDTATLARLIVGRFLFLLGIYAVGRFLLLFTAERLGLAADAAAAEAGAALALLTLLTAAAAVPAGWLADRIGRPAVMLGGGVVGAAGVAALPLADSLPAILAFGTLMAVGSAAFGAGSWAALADVTAARATGRLLGIANLGTAGAAAAAGLFGPLIDAAGFGIGFALAGLAAASGAVVAWRARVPGPQPSLRPLEVPD